MDSKRVKELKRQIRDAKRTGDTEWAKELEEELEEELRKDEAAMDHTPENDEEAIEQLYELNPDVEAELVSPMVTGYLIDPGERVSPKEALANLRELLAQSGALVTRVGQCLRSLVGNAHYYKIDDRTFGLTIDLTVEDFAKRVRAIRTSRRMIKHGRDFLAHYRTALGDLEIRVDARGNVDSVTIL